MGKNERLRIVVLGYLVRGPLGGLAWHHVQYVLCLLAMGHDVLFVEESENYAACYDPDQDAMTIDPTYGLRFADATFKKLGAPECWAYHDKHQHNWLGPAANRVPSFCETADVLLNLSGVNSLNKPCQTIPRRVFIDTDPGFTQIRHLTDSDARHTAENHTHFFTFGENFGNANCLIPDDGFAWQPTRQPVSLDHWPVFPGFPGETSARFTTVMQWDSYSTRTLGDLTLGMKSQSFEPFLQLPGKVTSALELSLGSANEQTKQDLINAGWFLRSSIDTTIDPWTYQDYLKSSKAEFSVAKHGYVATNSGWFSERSAAYLASGRPVVVQDTGFTDWLRTDAGVIAFNSIDEAVDAIQTIERDYSKHCQAAREVAREYFDGSRVLGRLLNSLQCDGVRSFTA